MNKKLPAILFLAFLLFGCTQQINDFMSGQGSTPIRPLPANSFDLTVSKVTFSQSVLGEPIQITIWVKNIGIAPFSGIATVSANISSTSGERVPFSGNRQTRIEPNKEMPILSKTYTPSLDGIYTIAGFVKAQGEYNSRNNSKSVSFEPLSQEKLSLSIATQKDEYRLGENIRLTNSAIAGLSGKAAANEKGKINFLSQQTSASAVPPSSGQVFGREEVPVRFGEIVVSGKEAALRGQLEVIIADNFETGLAFTDYFLKQGNARYQIYFHELTELVSGVEIEAIGSLLGTEMAVTNYTQVSSGTVASAQNPNLGEQKTVVLLVNFQDDLRQDIGIGQVRDKIFDNQDDSLNAYVKDASYGKAFLTGDVFGWFTLPINKADGCSNFYRLYREAITASDNQVNFRNYSRVILVQPTYSCGTIFGMSTVGGIVQSTNDGNSTASVLSVRDLTDGIFSVIHEFGHSLGGYHANLLRCFSLVDGQQIHGPIGDYCESQDYGDPFDALGGFYKGHYNAIHKEKIGWLDESNVETLTSVSSPQTYILEPIETPGSGIKTLKIVTGDQTYYLEYRRPIGYDQLYPKIIGNPAVFDGLFIHNNKHISTGDSQLLYYFGNSNEQFTLPLFETFSDPKNNLEIKTMEVAPDHLTVQISSLCGNLVVDEDEECDTFELNSQTCENNGYLGGRLTCTSSCHFNYSGCEEPICGLGHTYNGGNSCTAKFTAGDFAKSVYVNSFFRNPLTPELWADLRSSERGTEVSGVLSGTGVNTQTNHLSGSEYKNSLGRAFFPFYTTTLPNGSNVISADLTLKGNTYFVANTHPDSDDYISVVLVLKSTPFLTVDDFGKFGVDELSNRNDLSENSGNLNDIILSLNSAGREKINKTGFSTFGIRTGYDLSDNIPNGGEKTKLSFFLPPDKLTINYINGSKDRSLIKNLSQNSVSGLLTLKVQKLLSGQWLDWQIFLSENKTVPTNGYFPLAELWPNANWVPTSEGNYRALAEFKVSSLVWSKSSEFSVKDFKRVFVTSEKWNGNLGGLSGADQKCQQAAESAELGGNFRAWISGSDANVEGRLLHHNKSYVLLDGSIFAPSFSGILNGSVYETIFFDEYGQKQENEKVWTGLVLRPPGNRTGNTTLANCVNWSTVQSEGTAGSTSTSELLMVYEDVQFYGGWNNYYTIRCDQFAHLYCFEQ